MDDRTWILFLRLAHIVAGLFWVGGVAVMAWFLLPAQRAAGESGGQLLQRILVERRLPVFLGIAMLLTLASGFGLYGLLAAASGSAWTSSRPGMAFGFGGLLALLAALTGIGVGATTGRRLAAIGRELQQSGGRPDPARLQQMAVLQRRAGWVARTVSVLLLLAAGTMAVARYL